MPLGREKEAAGKDVPVVTLGMAVLGDRLRAGVACGLARGSSPPRRSAVCVSPCREFGDINNASFHLDMW